MKVKKEYSEKHFGWCVADIPRKLIADYTEHYEKLQEEQVVGILHEYMREALRYQHMGAIGTASMIALIREISRRMDGKVAGISYEHDMFLIDFCKRYTDLIKADEGCVSIW
jgi:hypothetical protein